MQQEIGMYDGRLADVVESTQTTILFMKQEIEKKLLFQDG
jgi:hypothetical protein